MTAKELIDTIADLIEDKERRGKRLSLIEQEILFSIAEYNQTKETHKEAKK